jgi:hypothetical protein
MRKRAGRLQASHSYGRVLVLVLCLFAFAAIAPDGAWETGVLTLIATTMLVVAAWTSGLVSVGSGLIRLVSVGGCTAAAASFVSDRSGVAGAVAIVCAVMVVATVAVTVLGILDQGEVNAQSVRGAICVYVLLGVLFVFVYGAVAALGSGPFFAQGVDGTRALRLYFSYVTLATLGYGDYTPAGDLGHLLAVLEALTGQLYLVIALTLLVARLGQPTRRIG